MKTKASVLCFFCLIGAMALFLNPAMASNSAIGDNESIIINNVSDKPQSVPRSIVPFVAEYDELLNTVVLTCVEPCGNVDVTLVSTAGDSCQTVFDTTLGYLIIPVSGESGYYTLTIVTSDNTVYEGEFCL